MHSAPRPASTRISRRQRQILLFCLDCLRERGFPPSIREIGTAVDLSSSSTVHSHLRSLEAKGFLRREHSKPRGMTVLCDPDKQPLPQDEAARLRQQLVEACAELEQAYRRIEELEQAVGAPVEGSNSYPQEVTREQ